MTCYSKDQLESFLLEELASESEPALLEHLDVCTTCQQILDDLSDDKMVRTAHEGMLRDDLISFKTGVPLNATADGRWRDELQTPGVGPVSLPLQMDKFRLKKELGAGGFATVYLADDRDLEREVAVKIPHLGRLSPDSRRRFLREGMAAASLHHPHIVPVLQAGEHQGLCFLVSEYIPGGTLRKFQAEQGGRCSAELAARILLPLADAIEHAHENSIVHRDVQPSNVLLDKRIRDKGLPFRPMLTDFGTARMVGPDQTATASGMVIGTAPYMAPEQVRGEEVGPACDIYSLGAMLFELIARRPPIQGSSNADTLHQVLTAEPPDLHQIARETPRDLSAICARCLEKEPNRRYASAAELASDLERFLGGKPTAARPLGGFGRMLRWGRRNPLPLAIMLTITALLMLIVGGLGWHSMTLHDFNEQLTVANGRALEQRDRAEASEARVRQLLYASDLRLAEKAWREGDLRTARNLLNRYLPQRGQSDLRGIEWYFLDRALHPQIETLANVGSALYFVRVAPDLQSFAVAGADGLIRLYTLEDGELLEAFESGQVEVNSVAFSPDSKTLASAGDDGSICLWDLSSGEQIRRIEAHQGLVFGVVFASRGQQLISCGAEPQVHTWDVATGRRLETYKDHQDRVEAIAVSPNGRWLASTGKDRTLVIRDLTAGKVHLRWDKAEGTLSAAAFSHDSSLIAVVQSAGVKKWLRVFHVGSKSVLFARQHPDGIHSVAFAPSSRHLLTTDQVGTVRVWKVARESGAISSVGEPEKVKQIQESRISSGVFGLDGNSVLAVGKSGNIVRWNWRHVGNHSVWEDGSFQDLHDLSFAPDKTELIVACNYGIASVEPKDGAYLWAHKGDAGRFAHHVVHSPGDDWIVVAKSSSPAAAARRPPAHIERWVDRNLQRVLLRTEGNYRFNDLTISPDGKLLAVSVNGDGVNNEPKELWVVDCETGDVQHSVPAAAGTKARFTPDGRHLFFGVKRDIHRLDLVSKEVQVRRDAHANSQKAIAISDDGRWLATCAEGREIKLWSLPSFEAQAVIVGHQGEVTQLLFSRDGRTLLSSSHDGTVKAWSVMTGQLLMNLHEGDSSVNAMTLSRDGRRLALIEAKRRVCAYAWSARRP